MKFVFDLDGTLCFEGRPISQNIISSLGELEKKGHDIYFASARPVRDMLPVIDESLHHHSMVGGNGSLVFQNKKILSSQPFNPKTLQSLKDLIHEYQATYMADSEWNYSYSGPQDHFLVPHIDVHKSAQNMLLENLDPVVKILILTAKDIPQLFNSLGALDLSLTRHDGQDVIDINSIGINKWSGLQELGLQKDEFIVFGNDTNDVPMFKNAQLSIQIGNHEDLAPFASESILLKGDYDKAVADRILSFC